jgi:glycosyltransferase involved in cell wall biosynthesis
MDHCEIIELDPARLAFRSQIRRVRDLVQSREIDILHSHDFKTRVLASRLDLGAHISTAHGHIQTGWKSRVRNTLDRHALRSVDHLLVVSEAMRRKLSQWGVTSTVVRNSIALDHYPYGYSSQALRTDLGWSSATWILGCVGRLSSEKGQSGVVRAFKDLRQTQPHARLVFAGDGPDHDKLETMCERAGLADAVRFLGHRADMLEVYGGLDALVLNSRSEGMPNVVLEALALGVPVAATAVGGTPELIRHNVDGLLYEDGDEAALRRALETILCNKVAARDRARSGRARVETEFAMQHLVTTTHDIYRREHAQTSTKRRGQSDTEA